MHLRQQQQEQQLLSRLQRPAAAPSEGERHGGEVLDLELRL